MDKEKEIKDRLCSEVKRNNSDEYIEGYLDAVLDFYNALSKEKLNV